MTTETGLRLGLRPVRAARAGAPERRPLRPPGPLCVRGLQRRRRVRKESSSVYLPDAFFDWSWRSSPRGLFLIVNRDDDCACRDTERPWEAACGVYVVEGGKDKKPTAREFFDFKVRCANRSVQSLLHLRLCKRTSNQSMRLSSFLLHTSTAFSPDGTIAYFADSPPSSLLPPSIHLPVHSHTHTNQQRTGGAGGDLQAGRAAGAHHHRAHRHGQGRSCRR